MRTAQDTVVSLRRSHARQSPIASAGQVYAASMTTRARTGPSSVVVTVTESGRSMTTSSVGGE